MKTLLNYWRHSTQVSLTLLFFLSTFMVSATTISISGPTSVCEGDVVDYTYPFSPGHVYNWSSSGGTGIATINTINNTAVFTVTWGLAGSGSISIQEFAGGTLINNDSKNVTINPAPNPLIVSDFNSDCIDDTLKEHPNRPPSFECETVCEDSPVNYTTTLVAGNSYQWTVIGSYNSIIGSTTNSATVTWGSPGQAYVVVTETTPAGCTQTDTVCIEIVEKPRSRFKVDEGNTPIYSTPNGANSIYICRNSTVCFDDLSVGANSWFWDFGNGNTSQQQNPCETYTLPGVYTVMQVVENNCHCTDTTYLRVVVSNDEGPEIVCQNTICNNGTFVYDAILPTPCSGGFYQWTISNNGTIVSLNGSGTTITPQYASGTNSTSIEINWGSGPTGVISLKLVGCGGICDEIVTVNIPIIPNTLSIQGDDVVCHGDFGYYQVPCFPGTTYNWKVNGVSQPGNDHEFAHVFSASSTPYDVTVEYTNSFLGCMGSSSVFQVTVLYPFSISGPDKVCEGSSITITGPSGTPQLNWEVKNQAGTVVGTGGPSPNYGIPSSLTPGSYTVIAEDVSSPRDYCNDYAVHGFNVIAKPPTPTVINGTDEVCVGEVSIYTASPSSSDYYLEWEVTNGGSPVISHGNSLTITWNSGTKNINLYHVSKIGDCKSDPFPFPIIDKPTPTFTIQGNSPVCANTEATAPEVYFTTTLLDGYAWSIIPANAGSVVSGQGTASIDVIWNNYNGSAIVRLTPETCGVAGTPEDETVIVNTSVMSISSSLPYPLCQNVMTTWTGSFSFGTGTGYTWDITEVSSGSVIASGGTNPASYDFPNHSGSFVLSMSATNCGMVHTVTENITVNPAPVANLTYTGNKNCIDQYPVTFFVSVQGTGPYTYDWYKNGGFIGNLGTSHNIGPNPGDAGNYSVVITDANGCTSSTNIVNVIVCGPPPPPCISSGSSVSYITQIGQTSPTPGCNIVRFIESTFGMTPSSLSWYFADLGFATGSMPTFVFPASGVYPVTLVATYPGFCDTSYTFDVVVPVIADYELNISCAGNVFDVDLINTTDVVHGPLSTFNHNWTVTDITGTPIVVGTSTSQDYNNVPGLIGGNTYEVTLVETKSYTWNGQFINASCTYVNTFVMPFKANAAFASSNVVCIGNPMSFADLSVGNIISWTWNFGDGSSILTQNPEKTYTTTGIHTVSLDVVDEFGCTSNYSTTVDVKANNVAGNISVVPTTMPMCPGTTATLTFNNTTSPASGPYSYLWSDGTTGISTSTTQTSTHYLAVIDTYGCLNSFGPETVEVVEIPLAVINGEDEYCVGDDVTLTCNYGNTFTYNWYEDITNTGTYSLVGSGTNYVHTNVVVGTHKFKVELVDINSGCTKESLVFTVTVHPNPAPPIITTNPTPACPDSPVLLTATNAAIYNHVSWSTGDVGSSSFANSSGTYYAVGTDANGCSNYSSTVVYELPDFCSFMCGCYSDCIDQSGTYNFPGVLGSYSIWRWEQYISGSWVTINSGSGTVPDFVATSAGNYTIRLYVQTYDGCDGYSCEVDLTLVPCDSKPCEGKAKMYEIQCDYNPDLGVIYRFDMDISFGAFGAPCKKYSYTIIPPFGNIPSTSLFPNTITPGSNHIAGQWFTGLNYYAGGVVCFDIIITNLCDSSTCSMTVCFDVEPCGEPGKGDKLQKGDKRLKGSIESIFEEVQFYPNPSSGILKIKAPQEGKYQISIFDMSGKIVFNHTISIESNRIVEFNLQDLPVGPYSIQCIGNESIKTQRLIILKE